MLYDINFKRKYINKNQSLHYQAMLILMNEFKRCNLGKKTIVKEYIGNNEVSFNNKDWIKMCSKLLKLITKNHRKIIDENFIDFKNKIFYIEGLVSTSLKQVNDENFIDYSIIDEKFTELKKNIDLISIGLKQKNDENFIDLKNQVDLININLKKENDEKCNKCRENMILKNDLSQYYNFEYDYENKEYVFKLLPDGYRYQYNHYMKPQDRSNFINNKIQSRIFVLTLGVMLYYFFSWFKPELNLSEINVIIDIIIRFLITFKEQIFLFFKIFQKVNFEIFKAFLGVMILIKLAKILGKQLEVKK